MPFTPFHLGPGALIKALAGPRFSFMIFGGSQVLMDIEPLLHMLRQDRVLHGPTHTLAGAGLIGLAAAMVGKPMTQFVFKVAKADALTLTWGVALTSALAGTFSHILLDGMMHADMSPFWPITDGNALLDVMSVRALHLVCTACGALGVMWMVLRSERQRDEID